MAHPNLVARLLLNHPALALGVPWGVIMILVMTLFSVFQGQDLWQTLILHVPIYGLAGLAFGFGMKWWTHRRMRQQAETEQNDDETPPSAA